MEKIPWFVCIPIVFGISFVINTILAIAKGNKKFKVRAIIDAFLGMLSVFRHFFIMVFYQCVGLPVRQIPQLGILY